MKRKNYEIKNKTELDITTSAGITELVNGDKEEIVEIIIDVTGKIEDFNWGDIPSDIRRKNNIALKRNKGVIIAQYVYNYTAICAELDFDEKTFGIALASEVY